jgi:peptidoglycan/xylan/chitin deacetylase (PgdA/CDA1 family)
MREWIKSGLATAVGRRPPFILCYHGVGTPGGNDPGGLFVSRAQFAEHLDTIRERGYSLLTVSELWQRISAGDGNGFGAVTFDDAIAQTGREAMPELAARDMPSTMYVATGLLGGPHPHLPSERIMDPDEILELAAGGVEIGAHTADHPRLTDLSYDSALEELRRSRDELVELVDREIKTMAYPFGAHDEQTIEAVVETGYETACACEGAGPWQALRLPREPVFPSTTRLRLLAKMAGLYGPVHTLAARRGAALEA